MKKFMEMKDTLLEINENLQKEAFLFAEKRAKFILGHIKKYFSLTKKSNILDIGCGNGVLLDEITESTHKYGIEFSEHCAELSKKKGIKVYIYDLNRGLPPLSITFDLIFCIEVLEHLVNGENLLKQIKKQINKKGILVISVPNDMGYLPQRFHILLKGSIFPSNCDIYKEAHLRFFSLSILQRLLKKQGFIILKAIGYNFDERIKKIPFLERLIKILINLWPSVFATNFLIIARPE